MALLLAAFLLPPAKAVTKGVRKYSPTLAFCSLLELDNTHITKNSAISAVIKSAKAIFQLPPWWPLTTFLRRMMMGRRSWLIRSPASAHSHCAHTPPAPRTKDALYYSMFYAQTPPPTAVPSHLN